MTSDEEEIERTPSDPPRCGDKPLQDHPYKLFKPPRRTLLS